ncbi:BTAD domain-containing putative transcriptional regulator [Nocardia asteroides]|uniref:BTAD domain-containing putative transcriptional regulator n=1 Tax=Nocardia asteroides TaxID=1824 RepID=UPI0037C8AE5B
MSAQHLGPDGPHSTVSVAVSHPVVGVLGVIAIRRGEELVALPGARARVLLTALAVRPGRARSAQSLVDEVWGDRPPRAPMNALHTQVSRLRALLPDGALEIGPAGYRLTLPADAVDLAGATGLVRRADDLLAAGEVDAAQAAIGAARALWRGDPGADLPDCGPAEDLRAAADALSRDLTRVALAAHIAHGDLTAALPLARAEAAAHPLDEAAHTTLIRLLAADGRAGDALDTFAAYRLRLIEELGADPGPALIALNTAVLRGEPIELPGARSANRRPAQPGDRTQSPHPDRAARGPSADMSAAHPGTAGAYEMSGVSGGAVAPETSGAAGAYGSSGVSGGAVAPDTSGAAGAYRTPGVSGSVDAPDTSAAASVDGRPDAAARVHGRPDAAAAWVAPDASGASSGDGTPGVFGSAVARKASGATAAEPPTVSRPEGGVSHGRPATSHDAGAFEPVARPQGPDDSSDHAREIAGGTRTPVDTVAASDPIADPTPGTAARNPSLSALGLRAAPNELLGRAADLDAIADLTRRSRVTTILGPGGTGKTRVANAVGERFTGTLPVVLVELAPVQAESASTKARVDIEAAIGHVMGLGEVMREPGGLRLGMQIDARRRLQEALDARPMLLILDNCEHVVESAAELVADLVGSCAQLTVLTTSRSPLAITAESVYPLLPLAIDAAGSPATDLFSARARAVRPDVRLDPETVVRLCRTLDGLPLAIELAAARVRTMSVAEIESRLDHRFALLRSGDRTAPQRHRTLHAVIAWSWNLLDADQQVVLRRLSRFPGGFTLSAAEVVGAGPEVPDVAAAIEGLVGQSLLTVLDDPDGTGIRYRMLETVREFGAEQLDAVDATSAGAETALVRDRMARWARGFVRGAVAEYRAGQQVPVVLAVTAELDNLVAILRTATAQADVETVYTVFPVTATVWVMRGAHLEFIGWAVRLVAIAPPTPVSGLDADLQMVTHMLTCLHLMFHNGGDVRPVAVARLRARRLLAHPGLDPGLRLLGSLITVRLNRGRIGRLLADGVRSPEPTARVAALVARANFWENAGNVVGSTRDSLLALADLENGDVWGTSMVCQHLAQLCGQSARYTESVTYYRRALTQMHRLRVHDEILESRCYLAAALIGSGRREEARAELDLVVHAEDSGLGQVDDPTIRRNHRLSGVATALAELELADGEIDAGLRHYRRSLELIGWPEFELSPGPGAMMVSAAAVSAHVLHGRAADAADLVAQIVATTDRRLSQYLDLPQIGAVACAVGSYLLATGPDRPEGLELLTLAVTSVARQDYPSMEMARHLAFHRDTVGADALTEAVGRSTGIRRLDAAARIVALTVGLDRRDSGTRP